MTFPERFNALPDYAFPRLRALLRDVPPGGEVISMSIGEPRHPMPPFLANILARNIDGFAKYPPIHGTDGLRASIAAWIRRRYGADLDPDTRIMPLNGTREGLFNTLLALCPERKNGHTPLVLMPNPFYQVYAVAAIEARAEPVYLPATAETGFLPDFAALPSEVLDRTAVAFICSPSNPQGAVADAGYWRTLMDLAERHDFKVFADECYSEIYRDAPPPGILACAADPERALAFHSLSKRSNLPGLRSGFVASGPGNIAQLKKLREYCGAPLPLPVQAVSDAAWSDEAHVNENRALYRQKFEIADHVMADVSGYAPVNAGFFLWLPVDDGEAAAKRIWAASGVRVLPGAYLSRSTKGQDPGANYIRIAMVADQDEFRRGLSLVRDNV